MQRYLPILLLFITGFYSNQATAQYCTPKYTGAGHPQTSQPTSFFTHILRVSIANIDRVTPAPLTLTNMVYQDFTKDTIKLTQTAKYPLTLELGNGANTQTAAIWIDYNQNGVFESVERVFSRTDIANAGNHKYNITVEVPKNAVLGNTRMRVGTLYGTSTPDPCNNSRPASGTVIDWSQDFQDYTVHIAKPTIQLFESVAVSHSNFDEILAGSANNDILRIEVTTNEEGVISPLSVDSFYFNILGSTNPADITKARLYYTGKNPVFTTFNLIDSTSKIGSSFILSSSNLLRNGTNYFWLALDTKKDALLGNRIDAQCTGIHLLTKRVPNVVSPNGSRVIGYCSSKGNRSNFVYVRRVNFGNINIYSGYSTLGYSNYTFSSTTAARTDTMLLTVEIGNGVNNSLTKAWIDFNADGDFDDPNEEVLFDSITTASQANLTYGPLTAKVYIPANAKVGPTRMRVSTGSRADAPPYKPAPNACDATVEIGEVEDYTINIYEDGEPVSLFNNTTVCFGDSTSFIDASYTYSLYSINSWKWDFGDGNTSTLQNPKHLYAKSGVYKVSLITNTNKPGTPDTIYKIVNVEQPKPDFSMSTTLINTPIYFTDATNGATVVRWEWKFGDPSSPQNISYLSNPTFEYAKAGKYRVVLTVTTLGGCMDSVVKEINIVEYKKPIANFNAQDFNPYKGAALTMQDISANRPTSWKWRVSPASHSFVNGTNSNSQNPIITLNTIGTYKVTLVAENKAGKDSITREFITKDYSKPTADFSANQLNVKAGQIVSFLDLSTNDPTDYQWLFGDGDTSFQANPVHQYDLVGKYSVELNVENPAGKDSEKKIDYITVTDEYVLCESDVKGSPLYKGKLYDSGGKNGSYSSNTDCGFLIKPACAGPITISFSKLAMDATDYVRVFDGVDNTGIPLHTGAGFTGYTVPSALKANSGAVYIEQITDSSIDTTGFELTWSAAPNIKPKALILADSVGYVNSVLIATNNTVVGTGNTYYWDLDDDGIIDDTNSTNVKVLFNSKGQHRIKLIAVNCKGSDTVYHSVRVDTATAPPIANFSANTTKIFAGDELEFTDLSSNGPNQWEWEVSGDPYNYMYVNGTDEFSRNPTILFFEPGYYTISLTASNDLGAGKRVVKNNYILVQTRSQLCLYPYDSDQPAGRLTDDGGEDIDYRSRSCDFLLNPCAKEIVLDFKKFEYGPGDFLRVYDGEDASGTALHTGTGFTFGDKPGKLVAKSGRMYIEHIATGINTTFDGFVADWSTIPFDAPDVSFESPDTAYTGGNIIFMDNTTDEKGNSNVLYYWDFDNNGIVDDSTKNGSYSYTTAGIKTIELLAIACEFRDSITKTIRVINPKGKPKAEFTASQNFAATTDVVRLTDKSTNGPGTWKWTIVPSTYSIVEHADTFPFVGVMFNEPDTYTVSLRVQNNLGADSITKIDYIAVYEYCTPVVINGPTIQIGISYVAIGDISNSSAIGNATYTDYTSTVAPAQLTAGGKHPIRLARNLSNPAQNFSVWIDLNQDGIFADSNENVLRSGPLNVLVLDDTLSIPTTAKYGATRMRIGTSLGTDANFPCGANDYGEFEDYRVIIGADKVKPEITLLGNTTEFIEVGDSYNDAGATAWDNVDGDITANIVSSNNVDTAVAGTYQVTFDVSDQAGNKAARKTRTVVVSADKTKPVIQLIGADSMAIHVFTAFVDPGATATDNFDGDVTANIAVQNNIDTARVGTYDVIYSAYDNSNNAADAITRRVSVVDTVKPVIVVKGLLTDTLKIGDKYIEDSATVTDNYYQDVDLIISGNVNTNLVGTYSIFYDANDRSGNSAVQKERIIVVRDPQSINNIEGLSFVNVFPNPASNVLNLQLEFSKQQACQLVLLNSIGKEIKTQAYTWSGLVHENIDVSNLAPGIYFIKISTASGSFQKEFSVVK